MRYTTIIDISEFPALYRNPAIRLLYLHLCLRAGYHDYDRDLCQLSIRRLAYETGLSVAAVRNALAQLEKFQMIKRNCQLLQIRKFVIEQPISKRAKSKREEKQMKEAAERAASHDKMEAERDERTNAINELRAQGKTSFMVYYEEQLARANAGEPDAIAFVQRNKNVYNEHAKQFKQ